MMELNGQLNTQRLNMTMLKDVFVVFSGIKEMWRARWKSTSSFSAVLSSRVIILTRKTRIALHMQSNCNTF